MKGKGMGGGMQALMRKANQMQSKMKQLQEELDKKEYTATSGGDAIAVTVNGEKKITAVKINPEVLQPEDAEMLQDLFLTATNEALAEAKSDHDKQMEAVTGGALPGFF